MQSDLVSALDGAVAVLRQGGIIACPAETMFGLGVDPFQQAAVTRLLQLKQRPADKGGLILLVADLGMLRMVACEPAPLARRLMDRFWPGPLTLVLPAHPALPHWIAGPDHTVAVRIPAAPVATALLAIWRKPLVSTSANRSGLPPARCADELRQQWPELYIVPDGGTLGDGDSLPSTLIDLHHPDRAVLLRSGAIPDVLLRQEIPHLEGP
ncbi:MAG: threonylcarbamoyl-AMP synthase [Magnetococcales bacterium]|nr:threonylcarbamoyl-AMP synthase [Magnetococcales bacterium]